MSKSTTRRALASFRDSTIANAAVAHHGQGGFFVVNIDGRTVTLRERDAVVATYRARVTPGGRLAFA